MTSRALFLRSLALLFLFSALSACDTGAPGAAQRYAQDQTSETLQLAQATTEAGDPATAAKLFEKVLRADPISVPALLGAGDAYARMGQNDRAEAVLERAHELAPNNAEVLTTLGRVKLAQGQPTAALEEYEKALRIDRRNVAALTGKGVALDQLSRHADAQAVYETALAMYPANFILRSNYALSLAISGQMVKGTGILQELVRDPNAAPHVRGNLALVYGLAGRDTDARATLALDMSPAQVEENIAAYRAIRRLMLEDKPIGALIFM
ncbi:tetratricopeptide repeat protein [Celeribacter indicus]|uniref:Uncharacterized protein n=1 Tax=Celeribacter indicus TaxID=1208324 RepID=A0A0B5DZG3_9RHOB|nr:tetratricopeptide repeat protein [Celeribacter indicus]AJE48843.1 hypothetical protein P73_4128 [Celeribacter indicus]SDW38899.1 Flp pilus assembly protein TadD, contains TPR repeats [Celeribacter indicus]